VDLFRIRLFFLGVELVFTLLDKVITGAPCFEDDYYKRFFVKQESLVVWGR